MTRLFHAPPAVVASDDWLTPPNIIKALGPFDLDPCASVEQPWRTATTQYTVEDNGLYRDWSGMVWCNPPYRPAKKWITKLAEHGRGIGLVFARTETRWWAGQVWNRSSAILFVAGRLVFHHPRTGTPAAHNSPSPSALLAYGSEAATKLRDSGIPGALVLKWENQ